MMDERPESLDVQLAKLSRDVAPSKNLWHGIVFGIARRQRTSRPLAYAAAAACALLATALTWAVLQRRPASLTTASTGTARNTSFDEPSNVSYTATRARLETTFNERLALLSPATRTQIEASLAVIRKAHDDIRKALAGEPANPVLEQLFESTWHDEFDLYDRVIRATQSSLTRT